MKKSVVLALVLILLFALCACNNQQLQSTTPQETNSTTLPQDNVTTPSQKEDLPRPETNLEFWIAENVDHVDFSKYQEKYGFFGGHEYYGTGYVPTIDEDEYYQIDPEYCVIYTVSSYPDEMDKEQHITSIYITDPNITFYGISLNSSVAQFKYYMQQQGFDVTKTGENSCKAEKGKFWVKFTQEYIIISVEITNNSGIIY